MMIVIASLLSPTIALAKKSVYVQASQGSFNDVAITRLFERQPKLKSTVVFSGTPLNTFNMAFLNKSLAFIAVENSTIPGNLVQATIEALQQYRIIRVEASITTQIEMCALMRKSDIEKKNEITLIASHPAALKQIDGWIKKNNADIYSVPEGTSIAAEYVSSGLLPSGTVAVGACALVSVYKNLIVIEQGIQDNKNNNTMFLLVEIEPRMFDISESIAKKELVDAIEIGRQLHLN